MKAKKYTVRELQEKLNMALSPDKPMIHQLEQLGVKELIEELSIYQQELEYQNDELRKTQVSLENSMLYAEDLFENAPVAYVILKDDFSMLRFNRLFKASFVHSAIEINRGTDFRRLVKPEDQDDFHRFLMRAKENQENNGINLQIEGRHFFIRAQKRIVADFPEWRISLTDVHNEQLVLAALAQSERRFRNLVNMAPQIIFTLKEGSMALTFVSSHAETLLGFKPETLMGNKLIDLVHPEDHPLANAFLEQLINMQLGMSPVRSDIRLCHQSGIGTWTALLGQKIYDSDSGKFYYLCIAHPIHELKIQQEALEAQTERLQHFSHIISHNLSSYVANVHSLVGLMGEEGIGELEKAELYTLLKQATTNLQEAVSNLNEMLKIQKNGHLGKVKMSLIDEVEKVLSALKNDIEKSGLNVSVSIEKNMEICFHPAYLQSILMNMCSNALRYKRLIKEAYLRISAHSTANHQVSLVFEDNGLGMDLTSIGHRLFGMFQTFHKHPDSKGLGLFMVKNQLAAMGGNIQVESKVGVGSKFELVFPVCDEVEGAV